AAVAGVASIPKEPRQGSNRVGFLHGADGDLSSAVRARDADSQPATAGAFQCHRASDCGMSGAPTARGVRAGGSAPICDSGPPPGLWQTICASGQDAGDPRGGCCATLAVAERLCGAGDWLNTTRVP